MLRCPRCGGGGLFHRWLLMEGRCPTCDLRFERVQGYWLGAVAVNLVFTEGLFVVVLVVWLVAAWPDVPWTGVLVATIVMNAVFPLLFHPFSRTLWLAIERHFYTRAHPDEDA
ncbi:MAG TPA: DUF983 domain-containing protein [Acidimicrobiia bacterium]|jgi:uncharacterized protein (DUF983 family)